jgi:hypothetical protein
MSLSAQAMRRWKLATIVSTTFIGFHTVFRTPYAVESKTQDKHVFTDAQEWYNRKWDEALGVRRDAGKGGGGKVKDVRNVASPAPGVFAAKVEDGKGK